MRWRTTAAATLAVAVFLAVAALAFAFAQRQQLEGSITEAARQQATDIAAQVAQDGAGADLAAGAGDQSLVQIVDADGNVLAASPSVEGEPPVVDARPDPGSTSTVRSAALPIGEGEDFVVVARGVTGPDGPVVVLVAQSLELVGQSTAVVVSLLLIGYPVVLLGVALTSYWLAGRALAPVEAIRTRVATVQGTSELDARVPVPDGDDEISRLAVTMNAMLERLETGSDRQRRFVGDASHELRSPLATIRAAHEIAALHPETRDCSGDQPRRARRARPPRPPGRGPAPARARRRTRTQGPICRRRRRRPGQPGGGATPQARHGDGDRDGAASAYPR